jgi:hypothetical protein
MDRIKIRQWMIGAGISQAQIGREAGVTRSMVNLVVSGKRRHKLVTVLLRGHGCPAEYLEKEIPPDPPLQKGGERAA